MPPLRDRSRRRSASLKHHDRHPSLHQVRSRGETLGARTDHSHRQDVLHSTLIHSLTNIDG